MGTRFELPLGVARVYKIGHLPFSKDVGALSPVASALYFVSVTNLITVATKKVTLT